MKFLLRHRGVLVILLVVALLLTMTVASLISRGVSPVSNLAGILFKPLQVFMSGVVDAVESMYGSRYEYDSLAAERDQLRIRVAELEKSLREYSDAVEENERLRELLNVRTIRPELHFEPAGVVTRDASNWARTFSIDRGSNAGISVGDCAVSSEFYFVGVVTEVGYNWATVVSVVDTDTQLGARVFRTGLTAVAQGDFALMQQGKLALTYLPVDADIQNGDEVLSSGAGGVYPKDIPIGRVVEMQTECTGISARAVIEPLAELDRLTQIFIITEFDEMGDGGS